MYLSINQMENNETISTSIRVESTMTVKHTRLRLYKHGSPDGTLTLVFKDGSTEVGTASVAVSDINAEVGTYFHGYVRFDLGDAGVRINLLGTESYKELDVEVTLSGHTDSASNYIGLVKNFEGAFVGNYGTISNEDDMAAEQLTHFQPYGIEIFRNKQV